jgi:hypothetical protein
MEWGALFVLSLRYAKAKFFVWLLFFGIKKSNGKPSRKFRGKVIQLKKLLKLREMKD